jgi:bacteriocin biosynthesis cyclodehydratase domain-containing protein
MVEANSSPIAAPVEIISVGPFGHAVAECLNSFRDDVFHKALRDAVLKPPEVLASARMRIIAAWRPVPAICARLDQISFGSGCSLIPVVIDGTVLQIGPVIVPLRGGCWACWVKRSNQHTPRSTEQFALASYYASHPEQGPAGYLHPFAALAAAKLSQIIDDIDAAKNIGGYAWRIDVITRAITVTIMAGVHDCPQCGLKRPEQRRSFDEMAIHLKYLWTRKDE